MCLCMYNGIEQTKTILPFPIFQLDKIHRKIGKGEKTSELVFFI